MAPPSTATIMTLLAAAALVTVCVWATVPLLLRTLKSREISDRPNARSSHSIATPKGGGLVVLGQGIFRRLQIHRVTVETRLLQSLGERIEILARLEHDLLLSQRLFIAIESDDARLGAV